jgi:signal transduction histidine kinase
VKREAKFAADALTMRIAAIEQTRKELEHDPQFDQLRKEFASIGVTDKAWRPYGSMLISRTSTTALSRPMIVAVQRDVIFAAVQAARNSESFTIRVDAQPGAPGESSDDLLDEQRLPGLTISFGPATAFDAGPDLWRSLYAPALLLVVVLIILGGYLLWRDTRREVHTAELRSQFVASVSHELKTPLTSIRMFAEIMQGREVDSVTREECVDTIINESERLTRLLNNVLDFSRIEHGQKSYRLETTRLSEVVGAAVKTMQHPLAEQGFDLSMDIDDRMPPVRADRDALTQAVLNLLTNAMKYSGQSRKIQLRLLSQNGDALIQVSDRGIGIPKREQSRIFEKFYRARVRENQSISGTGLGLALVAHIVHGHGGKVHVESSPGVGSRFTISIPLIEDSNDARTETTPGVYGAKGASS